MEKEIANQLWLSQIQASKVANVPGRTLREWISTEAIAVNERREVNLVEVFRYKKSRQDAEIERLKSGPGGKAGQRLLTARIRKTEAESDLLEYQLARREEAVVALSEAIADFDTIKKSARERFLAMPAELAELLANISNPKEINQLIEDFIHHNLTALAVELSGED